jgi:thiol-disulfide isomerase/thioredoxin
MRTLLPLLMWMCILPMTTRAQDLLVPEFRHYEDLHPLLHRDNDTTYVINFWATWCKPCVRELPLFERLYDHYAGQPVKILLVSLDMRRDLETRLPRFLRDQGIRCEVLALTDTDGNAWIPRVDPDWSGAIPATLVRRGARSIFSEEEWDDLPSLLDRIEQVRN